MDFENLIAQQKAMLAGAERALTGKGLDLSDLGRAVAVLEARRAAVDEQIAALKTQSLEEAAQIDARIASLEAEGASLDAAIKGQKTTFDPATKAAPKVARKAQAEAKPAAPKTAARPRKSTRRP
jgi:hypothetical protein